MSDELLKRIKQLNEMSSKKLESELSKEIYAHKIHELLAGTKALATNTGRDTFRGEKVDFIFLDEEPGPYVSQEEIDEIFDKVLFTKELEEELKKSNTKEKRKLKI